MRTQVRNWLMAVSSTERSSADGSCAHATSTQPGFARWDDPWTLNRIRMTNSTGPRDLAALLHA